MRDKPYFAVVYMFVVTAFFSAILIGFARMTRGQVEANKQIALEKAIVQVFPEIEVVSNAEVHNIFTSQFKTVKSPKDEDAIFYAVYYKNDAITGYAVRVEGQGFWAPIKGFVGVAADKRTITGVAFYEQSETPGLGARIDEDEFRKQFVGKTIEDSDEPIGIVSAAQTPGDNEVHAVTGATQTSVRLEKLMNQYIRAWLDAMQNKETAP